MVGVGFEGAIIEKVGAQLSARDLSIRRRLDRASELRRHLFGLVEPVPDMTLLDTAGASQCRLTAAGFDSPHEGGVCLHGHGCYKQNCSLSTNRFAARLNKPFCKMGCMMTLGERIAHARKLAGDKLGREVSQSELARLVGVKPQSIQAIEAGKVKSSRITVKAAMFLGVPVEWLDAGAGGVPDQAFPAIPKEEGGKPLPDQERDQLASIIDALDEAGKNKVRDYAAYVLAELKSQKRAG